MRNDYSVPEYLLPDQGHGLLCISFRFRPASEPEPLAGTMAIGMFKM